MCKRYFHKMEARTLSAALKVLLRPEELTDAHSAQADTKGHSRCAYWLSSTVINDLEPNVALFERSLVPEEKQQILQVSWSLINQMRMHVFWFWKTQRPKSH